MNIFKLQFIQILKRYLLNVFNTRQKTVTDYIENNTKDLSNHQDRGVCIREVDGELIETDIGRWIFDTTDAKKYCNKYNGSLTNKSLTIITNQDSNYNYLNLFISNSENKTVKVFLTNHEDTVLWYNKINSNFLEIDLNSVNKGNYSLRVKKNKCTIQKNIIIN